MSAKCREHGKCGECREHGKCGECREHGKCGECREYPQLKKENLIRRLITGSCDIDINVVETGNPKGTPILFVHGFSQSWMTWIFQLTDPLLTKYFRLIAMDIRGHGNSEVPLNQSDYKGRMFANDIDCVIRSLGIKPVLVGHSMGALWVADYLNYFGDEEIIGVVTVGGLIGFGGKSDEYFGKTFIDLIPSVTSDDLDILTDGIAKLVEARVTCRSPCRNTQISIGYTSIVSSQTRRYLVNHDPLDPIKVWSKINVPILITHGKCDDLILQKSSKDLYKITKNSSISFFQGGHAIHSQHPTRFNCELSNFTHGLHEKIRR